MIRDLGQPVSAIHICEDASVIAGGWDGALKKWDHDGVLLWATQCEDRIESILIIEDLVIVTSGLHVTCVSGGEVQWSNPLEGSADFLTNSGEEIIATSSVYDIEHGDFMESAIWQFSLSGELIEVERMDERPWFIESKNHLVVGLGRPKCGVLIDGVHQDLATESPVTCGTSNSETTLFGHADGTISSLSGTEISKQKSSIEILNCNEAGLAAALESGEIVAMDLSGKKAWHSEGSMATTQTFGFNNLHWCGRNEPNSGLVEVRGQGGELIASAKISRPRVSNAVKDRVAFGFEDGQILLWEKELFERRMNEKSTNSDGRKSALAAKLRALRE